MRTAGHEQVDTVVFNIDAFMALSKIGFSSIERLTTLNLEATRVALDEGVSSYSSMLHYGESNAQPKLQATSSAVDYIKNVQEIAVETQQEFTKLMTSYVSSQGNGGGATNTAAWAKGFGLFKRFGEQITNMTEANSKAVGDVTARIAASASTHSKKVG